MMRLPRIVRRLLALAILAVLLGAVWSVAFQPLVDRYRADRQQIADDLVRIGRFERMIAERPVWEDQLKRMETESGAAAFLIAADNPAIAGAQLQAEVKRSAAVSGATVRSLQVLPAKDAGPFLQVGLRATMVMEMRGITTLLYQMEAAGRPFRVTQLAIRGNDIPGRSTQPGAQVAVLLARPLEVRFDLFALMRKPGPGGT